MTSQEELEILKRRIAELENTMPAVLNVTAPGVFAPVPAPAPLRRPSEYDRQLIRAIDINRTKDTFRALVESICFRVTTQQFNKASQKQRLILLRTLAGQSKVKINFKDSDELVYIRALVDAGVLQ